MPSTAKHQPPKQRIWDWPLRVCHWLIVGLVVYQWASVEWMEEAIDSHALGGYVLLGIVLFRLCWGIVGPKFARFSQFMVRPQIAIRYFIDVAKGKSEHYAGHNPLGGYSAIALLILLLIQSVTGLFMADDIFFTAPYYGAVEQSTQEIMSSVHHTNFTVLQVFIGLHLAAVFFYVFVKKQPLIMAMLHGFKRTRTAGIGSQKGRLAIVMAIVVAALVYGIVVILAPEPPPMW